MADVTVHGYPDGGHRFSPERSTETEELLAFRLEQIFARYLLRIILVYFQDSLQDEVRLLSIFASGRQMRFFVIFHYSL